MTKKWTAFPTSDNAPPTVDWSPPKLSRDSTMLDTEPDSSPSLRRPHASQAVSSTSTMTELDGGSIDATQFDGGLVSLRYDDESGKGGLVMEKLRRYVPSDEKPALVSGREAGAGWDLSGIRFAPLNIPLKRRLQTLVVLFHTLSIALLLTLFFFLCAIPLTWPLVIPYTLHLLFSNAHASGSLARRSQFLRSLRLWSLFGSYFPARLHRTEPLPPTRKYVFGYHPHGIISHGAFAAFATEALGFAQLFPGLTNTLLTLDSNFRIPLYRDYALAMGLRSVSRASCQALLGRSGANGEGMGRAITIVVGGAAESLGARPGTLDLILHKRKGFIKMAMRAGADLVPVLAFGENELYDQVSPERVPLVAKLQVAVKKAVGWTVPLFHARGVFNYDVGMMPYRRPVNVVVGRRIAVERKEKPEAEEVERLHEAYEVELQRIWEDWKGVFAPHVKGDMKIVE